MLNTLLTGDGLGHQAGCLEIKRTQMYVISCQYACSNSSLNKTLTTRSDAQKYIISTLKTL